MTVSSLYFGNVDRSGLTSYEAGFPLTYIDPQVPIAKMQSLGAYHTGLLTTQERCTLKQYNTMESLIKVQKERELEEKRRRLNMQLSSHRARDSPSRASKQYLGERIQTARKRKGYELCSRASSPGEAVSAPERHFATESQPEPASECSFQTPAAYSCPKRWRQVLPPNRPPVSLDGSTVSSNSLYYSQPRACSPDIYQQASLNRTRRRQERGAGCSLLCSPVGQHSSDYIYVMNRLAPDIRYHSWRSRHSLSETSNATESIAVTPRSNRPADKSAAPPTTQTVQQRSRRVSPQKTLLSMPSVRLPQLDTKRRRASPGISPMHPVAQSLPEDSADMLTVTAIDLSDLRLEDLTLAG